MNKNPCLEVSKNLSPGCLQGAKHPHVQGLELICQIWRKAHESDVVRLAQVDHLRRDVAGQIVADEQLFAWPSLQFWEEEIHKPHFKQIRVKQPTL